MLIDGKRLPTLSDLVIIAGLMGAAGLVWLLHKGKQCKCCGKWSDD